MTGDAILKLASEFEIFAKKNKKWIHKGVKRPGRFKGWSLAKMKSRYNNFKKR